MTKEFHPLKVTSVSKTTTDCVLVEFEITNELKDIFKFKQGQYLTLRHKINNQDTRRAYSLCSSALENKWQVAIKKVPDGIFSTFANEILKAGDILKALPPQGQFHIPIQANLNRNYVAFAAGSGITPILSIIKTHLEAEPNSRFTLLYTNQNTANIILKEEIEGLKNIYLQRFSVYHILTRQPRDVEWMNGRINNKKLDHIFTTLIPLNNVDHFFICGPNQMIFNIRDYLINNKIEKNKIHFELFNTEGIISKPAPKHSKKPGKNITNLKIIEGGKVYAFEMSDQDDNILDAGLAQNADLPFACKGGVCSTCRAKVIKGKVHMKINYALEPHEVEKGYVLTCQGVPLSEDVEIDFDS